MDQEPPQSLPPEQIVAYDGLCARCGYNLFGLAKSGACPECGMPVLDSLSGQMLLRSSATYIRRLHSGAALVETSFVFLFLVHCVPALSALVLLLGCYGWWQLGTPPPQVTDQADDDLVPAANRVRRWTFAAALAAIGEVLLVGRYVPQAAPAPSSPFMASAVIALCSVPFAGLARSGFDLVRELTMRLPDAPLARSASRLKMLAPLWGLSLIIAPAAMALPNSVPASRSLAGGLLLLVIAGWVVGLIMLTTMTGFRGVLQQRLISSEDQHPAE